MFLDLLAAAKAALMRAARQLKRYAARKRRSSETPSVLAA